MTEWADLATLSVTEVIALQHETREWGKELRRDTSALVNLRLAKQIGLEEYAAGRQRAKDQTAECHHRTTMLVAEMNRRNIGPTKGTGRPVANSRGGVQSPMSSMSSNTSS
jgi:hypothetical protein